LPDSPSGKSHEDASAQTRPRKAPPDDRLAKQSRNGAAKEEWIASSLALLKRGIVGSSTRLAANACHSTLQSSSSGIIFASTRTFSERRLRDVK
jgi:hypothetical protein